RHRLHLQGHALHDTTLTQDEAEVLHLKHAVDAEERILDANEPFTEGSKPAQVAGEGSHPRRIGAEPFELHQPARLAVRRGHVELHVLGDLTALQNVSLVYPRVSIGSLIILFWIKEGGADCVRRGHDVPSTAEIRETDDRIRIDDDGRLLPVADVECQSTV